MPIFVVRVSGTVNGQPGNSSFNVPADSAESITPVFFASWYQNCFDQEITDVTIISVTQLESEYLRGRNIIGIVLFLLSFNVCAQDPAKLFTLDLSAGFPSIVKVGADLHYKKFTGGLNVGLLVSDLHAGYRFKEFNNGQLAVNAFVNTAGGIGTQFSIIAFKHLKADIGSTFTQPQYPVVNIGYCFRF